MALKTWVNVQVATESARATAVTITGITKANPGVATYTGTDPSNGDLIALSIQGMNQLDQKVVRVAAVNTGAKTFQLEGVDTTLFNTFSSGTFQTLTFGNTCTTAVNVNSSGGDPNFTDTSTIHGNVETRIPTTVSPFTISFELQWDPVNDAFQKAMKAKADSIALTAAKITYADGTLALFLGYVSAALLPTGNFKEVVKTKIGIESQGRPTFY